LESLWSRTSVKEMKLRPASKLYKKGWIVAVGALLVAILASGCAQSSPAPSSMEVVHGSYLHLTGNITDLRARVTEWQGGNADSLKLAGEKLDRVQVVLSSTGWPKEMEKSVARTKAAVAPMAKALKEEHKTVAEAASAEFGEAAHDIIHEFYGDYLPAMEGMSSGQMAAHTIYLDLAGNFADLQTRIANWQKGDEASMGVAKEKADRIDILIRELYPTGVMVRDLPPIQRALPNVLAAIERKDAAATAEAAKPIAEAARQLNKDAYTWMELVRGGKDPACVQASYLDITRSITDLRSGVTAWTKGDDAALGTATEKLARVNLILAHTSWPNNLGDAADRTAYAASLMDQAVKDRNRGAVESASAEFSEASHDLTHAFYGDWLPGGGLKAVGAHSGTMQEAPKQAQAASSGGHGHGGSPAAEAAPAEGPDWGVLGAFAAAMVLVVGAAGLTKPRVTSAGKATLPTAEA
jgi:hypothetical protein